LQADIGSNASDTTTTQTDSQNQGPSGRQGVYVKVLATAISAAFLMIILAARLIAPTASYGQDHTSPAATSPDNSASTKSHAMTADQQSGSTADRSLTQKIRKAIMADKSLSTYGHNVKIITKDGAATLKGPVPSDDEKTKIASLAADAAGSPDKITNQLTVKQ